MPKLICALVSKVRLCKDKTNNKLHAIKIIKKEVMKKARPGSKFSYEDVKAEIAIMKKLNHPNVLRLYEVMDDPKVRSSSSSSAAAAAASCHHRAATCPSSSCSSAMMPKNFRLYEAMDDQGENAITRYVL
jgi:serine/threonine protein kinase